MAMDIDQLKIFAPGFISTLGEFLQIKDSYAIDSILFLDRNIVGRLDATDFPAAGTLDNIRFSALYAIWEANLSRVPDMDALKQQHQQYQGELRQKFGDSHVTDDSAVLSEAIIPSMHRYLAQEQAYLKGYLQLKDKSLDNRLDYIFREFESRFRLETRQSGINLFLPIALLCDLLGDPQTKKKGEIGTVLKAALLFNNGNVDPVTLYNIRSDFAALFLFWSMNAKVKEAWRQQATTTRIFFVTNDQAMARLFELGYKLAGVLQQSDMSPVNENNSSRLAWVAQQMFPRLKGNQTLFIVVIQQIQRLRIFG